MGRPKYFRTNIKDQMTKSIHFNTKASISISRILTCLDMGCVLPKPSC
jgi:hypothetical protein